jgi:hypothetical protein
MLPHSRGSQETAGALHAMIGAIEVALPGRKHLMKIARGFGLAGQARPPMLELSLAYDYSNHRFFPLYRFEKPY